MCILFLCSSFILHPESRTRTIWDTIGMIILFYVCIFVPIRVCFEDPAMVCPCRQNGGGGGGLSPD